MVSEGESEDIMMKENVDLHLRKKRCKRSL